MSLAVRRRFTLALFATLAPLILLGVVEVLLRWIEPAPMRLFELESEEGVVYSRDPGCFQVAGERPGAVDRIWYPWEAPAGVRRIGVVGESTAAGFPFDPYLSFGRIVEARIARAGGTAVQLLNAGKAADSSRAVLETVEALLALGVDAMVVSSGHNDFQVPYCDELRDRGVRGWLASTRIARSIAATRSAPVMSRAPRPETGDIGDAPFMTDAELERGAQRFRHHLESIASACERSGVPLYLATQVGNLRAFPPSYSTFAPDLLDADRSAFRELWERFSRRVLDNPAEVSDHEFEELVALDPTVAILWFRWAQVCDARADRVGAAEAYRRALALDRYPNRASAAFNRAIRAVAAAHEGVQLVDVEAAFQQLADGPVPGSDLFLDHCHPTVESTFQMAEVYWHSLQPRLQQWGVAAPEAEFLAGETVDQWLASLQLDRAFLAGRLVHVSRLNLALYLENPLARAPLELARSGLDRALAVDPENSRAWLTLAGLALLERDRPGLEAALGRVTELDPAGIAGLAGWCQSVPELQRGLADLGLQVADGRILPLEEPGD